MKRRKQCKWMTAIVLCLGIVAGSVCGVGAISYDVSEVPMAIQTAGTPTPNVVSYGVNVLAGEMDMAVWSYADNDAVFSQDAFARALNLSQVRYITIRSLPQTGEGELRLGSTAVVVGQTVSGENLSHLRVMPWDEGATRAAFSFTANGSATPIVCNVYFLKEGNANPTVSMASGLSLSLEGYRDRASYGTLSGYDPNGDDITFEVVRYPQNGALLLTDRARGSYVYHPNDGFCGTDSFSYVVRDRYGNYSASATVQCKVSAPTTSVDYVDMRDSTACNAAIALGEAGIMSGTQVGNQSYFYPEKGVSRVEFLVMAMQAAGIESLPPCENTAFFDDANIPSSMKDYVAAAYAAGYVNGKTVEGNLCFMPNEEITRAEAAVIVGNILGVESSPVIPVFADDSQIPVWARDAMYALNAVGILSAERGYLTPTEPLRRDQTADLLANVMRFVE